MYAIKGGIAGHLTSSAGWTLVDLISGAGGAETQLWDIDDPSLSANATYGLHLTVARSNVAYITCSAGSGAGSVAASNPDLSILEGCGKTYLFGVFCADRIFNGTLFYEREAAPAAVPPPAAPPLAEAGFGGLAMVGRRLRA